MGKLSPEKFEQRMGLVKGTLDYADIASTLRLPIGTVRSRLARGRAQLLDLLGNPDGVG